MPTSSTLTVACGLLAAYLVGSLPFGWLIARFFGRIDLREHGSGNIGATNVWRTMGFRWGALALLLDVLKGVLPVIWLGPALFGMDAPGVGHVKVACGLAAILGHMFPCWLKFRGGKGVATALGVVVVLAPGATLAAAAVFGVVFAATRIVSIASMTASVAFAIVNLWRLPDPFSGENWSLALFSLAVPLLIIVRHRTNIGRLWRGEEPRMQKRKDRLQSASTASGQQQQSNGAGSTEVQADPDRSEDEPQR